MLHRDFRQVKNGETTVVKRTLGWFPMGDSKSKGKKSLCSYISNSLTKIDEKIQCFWNIESYGTLPKMLPELLPPNEKGQLKTLLKTAVIKNNCIEIGLPWKREDPALPHNRELVLNQYQSIDKK